MDVTKYRGVVKAVPSGDTVVVTTAAAHSGPPPEKSIKLSGIEAPKFGWKPRAGDKDQKDRAEEPFAWESREALRKLLIGQQVYFHVDPKGGAAKRDYGEVYFGEDQEELSYWVIANGWAKLREAKSDGMKSEPHYQRLLSAQQGASDSEIGVWSKKKGAGVHHVKRITSEDDAVDLYEKVKGADVDAVVEQVRDGSTLRCMLLPGFQSVVVYIAGIRSPAVAPLKDGKPAPNEPFAAEAQFFTEIRLLHRNIKLHFEGVPDKRGNFQAVVKFELGDISSALVREGLARVVDWNAAGLPQYKALKDAENQAKRIKLRMWKNWTPVDSSVAGSEAEFAGRVIEVVSGDTLMVLNTETQEEKRVYLASILAPRMRVRPKKDDKADATPEVEEEAGAADTEEGATPKAARRPRIRTTMEPYAFEAREFLRKKLIGKKVHVTVDYIKGEGDSRVYGTIIPDDDRKNGSVAIGLVASGLAKVVHHGADEERAHDYEKLMLAESQCKKAGKGVHSKTAERDAPKYHMDAASDKEKAKIVAEKYKNERARAVVDFVINGSRFKVFLKDESVSMPFILAGVRTPKFDKRSGEAADVEPFGEDAFSFARRALLQHDVELIIEGSDRAGNLIGHIFKDRKNFSVALLDEGLGFVTPGRIERSEHYSSLCDAQEGAKAVKKKWWSVYVPPPAAEPAADEEEETAAASKRPAGREQYDVVVTEVVDCLTFYVQIVGEKSTAALEDLMKRFAEFHESASSVEDFEPKVDDLVSGQFTVDDAWYRSKILAVTPDGFRVQYIDYGNSETIPRDRLRPLPEGFDALMPQARECRLAFLVKPGDEDFEHQATDLFRELAYGKKLLLTVESRERGSDAPWNVSLFEEVPAEEGEENATPVVRNISGELLESGLVRLAGRPKAGYKSESTIKELREREATAKRDHVNLWRYGEIDYDEPADQKEVDRKQKEAIAAAKKAKAAGKGKEAE